MKSKMQVTGLLVGFMVVMVVMVVVLVGIGPPKVERIEQFDTNEEAFLVPLEGDLNSQAHMGEGVQGFEKQRVETQMVSLQQRTFATGRLWSSYKWVPTQRLVKIDTSPVTRDWTESSNTGTSTKNQAIEIESIDSIGLALPANITCVIRRGQGAKARYNVAGQSLEEIVDGQVHGYFQAKAAEKFGIMPLAEVNSKMASVGDEILDEARVFFQERGVWIESFSWKGGVIYTNHQIQEKIDDLFIAENDSLVAQREQATTRKANEILLSKAETQRDAAITAHEARAATLLKTQLEIRKIEAETVVALAKNFDGTLPVMVPAGSGLLFGIDKPYSNDLELLEEGNVVPPAPAITPVKAEEGGQQ